MPAGAGCAIITTLMAYQIANMRHFGWPEHICTISKITAITAMYLLRATIRESERKSVMLPDEEVNPLKKYVDAFNKQTSYSPPVINPTQAQYLIKALDYLKIWSHQHNDVIEQPVHDQVEEMMVDIVALAPEN